MNLFKPFLIPLRFIFKSFSKNCLCIATFKIIVSDSKVKSILINIFGGIVRCDVVAEGIVSAIQDVGIEIPVVVRLKGNNAEVAKDILEESRLNIFSELDLSLAAKKVVELSK